MAAPCTNPITNYLQHLQQKKKQTFSPIRSGSVRALTSSKLRAATANRAKETGVGAPANEQARRATDAPVWKQRQMRQLRKSRATSESSGPGNAPSPSSPKSPYPSFFPVTKPELNTQNQHSETHNSPVLTPSSTTATYVSQSSSDVNDSQSPSPPHNQIPRAPAGDLHVDDNNSLAIVLVDALQNNSHAYDDEVQVDFDSLCRQLVLRDEEDEECEGAVFAENEEENDEFEMILEQMIEDCEARWTNSSKLTNHPHLALIQYRPEDAVVSPEAQLRKEQIIAEQEREIAYLRAELARRQQLEGSLQGPHDRTRAAPGNRSPSSNLPAHIDEMMPPEEQIDTVPIEHIEVAVDDTDLCSVTSGLTNLVDLGRTGDESIYGDLPPPISASSKRPDAESVSGLTNPHANTVHKQRISLKAADGSSREALYSGPVQYGKLTGVGTLEFVKTGDTYIGEIVNGEMHGEGTYTYAKTNKKQPHRMLRGRFVNNVYGKPEKPVLQFR